jgi:hypothetical protein
MDFLYGAIYSIGSDNFALGYTIPDTSIENGNLIASHHSRHDIGGADAFTGSDTIAANVTGTCSGNITGTCSGNITGPLTIASYPTVASDPVNLSYFNTYTVPPYVTANPVTQLSDVTASANVVLASVTWAIPVPAIVYFHISIPVYHSNDVTEDDVNLYDDATTTILDKCHNFDATASSSGRGHTVQLSVMKSYASGSHYFKATADLFSTAGVASGGVLGSLSSASVNIVGIGRQ